MRRNTIGMLTAGMLLVSGAAWTMRPGQDGIEQVKKGDVVEEVVAPGIVEPVSEQVALSFEVSGRIVEMLVDEGDRVREGQLLARLDDRLARARVARAEAALESAKARRDAALKGSRADEVRVAEAEAEAAHASAAERAQWLARAEKLATGSGLTLAELDNARSTASASQAHAKAAEAKLALIKEGLRDEARREAIARVDGAKAELDEAKTLLSSTELRSPRTGVILRRFAEVGEQVVTTPQKIVLSVADIEKLQLRVEIDEADVGRVQLEQRGFATADAYGARRFPGHIVRTMHELGRKTLRRDDPRGHMDTKVLEAIFIPDNPAGIPLGLRMDVHVETVAKHGVLTVPLAAVKSEAGTTRIAVLEDGEEMVREIALGADNGIIAEVTAGLREGDLVKIR